MGKTEREIMSDTAIKQVRTFGKKNNATAVALVQGCEKRENGKKKGEGVIRVNGKPLQLIEPELPEVLQMSVNLHLLQCNLIHLVFTKRCLSGWCDNARLLLTQYCRSLRVEVGPLHHTEHNPQTYRFSLKN